MEQKQQIHKQRAGGADGADGDERPRAACLSVTALVITLLVNCVFWPFLLHQVSVINQQQRETEGRLAVVETELYHLRQVQPRAVGFKQEEGRRYRRDAGRDRTPTRQTNSSSSIHFEAHLPAELSHRSIGPEERIYIPDFKGTLTREGFQPAGVKYKFWRRTHEFLSVPEFLHVRGNHVTVLQTGVYHVYAQVLYHDLSGRWAFGIYVDDDVKLQCTTSSQIPTEYITSLGEGDRSGHGVYIHCYTAGGIYIQENQRVCIRSMYRHRSVVLLNRSTFWGIIKL